MIFRYKLESPEIDLEPFAKHHSGDETVAYKNVLGEDITLSYFYPDDYNCNKKYPAFVIIHGGGWASRKIFDEQKYWQGDYLGYLARFCAHNGFIGVSVDYRLSDIEGQKENYQIIDSCDDCFDAMDFILDNAEQKGIDTQNVYLLGESAGGHLAAYLTTKYKRDGFNFKTSFIVNGITDLKDPKWNPRVPLKSNHKVLSKIPQTEYAQFLSPIENIGDDICPVVLIHGTDDQCVFLPHSVNFYEKMQALNKKCELHIIEETDHAFLLYEYSKNTIACKIGVQIISKYLEL